MTNTDALQALADKVEAGVDTAHHHAAAFPSESAYGHCTWHDSHKASGGSLDAAKALHEAVLPGWWWSIGTCNVSDDARVSPHDDRRAPGGGEWSEFTDIDYRPSGNPARAWLLAILRALIAGGRDGQE